MRFCYRCSVGLSQPVNEVVLFDIKVHKLFSLKIPLPIWTSYFELKEEFYKNRRRSGQTTPQVIAHDKDRHMADTFAVGMGFADWTVPS